MTARRTIIGMALVVAISAFGGGIALIANVAGAVPLEHTPFATPLVPGLLLSLVVGGTSALAAVLAYRRSERAIDATILAGGALVVWIVAEIALIRTGHWLQLIYGGLGLALLALGMHAGLRSGAPRLRWSVTVTLAETAGYLVPSVVGIATATAGIEGTAQAALVTAAGFVEGVALGTGQALALPVRVDRRRYALLTGLGAALMWGTVMTLMLVGKPALIAVAGLVGLVAIGGAQWLELRHHVARAHRWIAWTAVAWIVALPLSFTPAPFVDASTPIAANVALWACGGALMAYVMALVTWQGAARLMQRERAWTPRATAAIAS